MTLEPLDFFTLVLAVRISTHVIFIACLAMMVSGRRWTPELPFAARCLPRHVTMTSGAAGGSVRSTRVAPCQNELPPSLIPVCSVRKGGRRYVSPRVSACEMRTII